jgi:hypothetical protein
MRGCRVVKYGIISSKSSKKLIRKVEVNLYSTLLSTVLYFLPHTRIVRDELQI